MVDQNLAWHADQQGSAHFRRKMDQFVDHVLYDAPTLAPAEDGLAVQKMLDAL